MKNQKKTCSTYTDNLFIRCSSYKQVLLVLVRVKLDTIGNLAARKAIYTLSCFRIPHFHISVIATTEELLAIVIKCNVSNSLFVAVISP